MTEKKHKAHVSEGKKKVVKELEGLIKSHKTILIASIKGLPGAHFQKICKKLRGKAIVKVPKKNLILLAIEDTKNEEIKKIEKEIKSDVAILFSNLDCFDLAGTLVGSKTPASGKAGQEAPEDISVEAGPTDLVPGPAISELGSLGIQVQIKDGKIEIKEPRVIVKKGTKISEGAASIMQKLDIKPFSVGFIPLVGFDVENKILYSEIKIDREKTVEELKDAFGRALPFAVSLGYVSKDTIKFLLGKAERNAKALEKFSVIKEEKAEETPSEEVIEENKVEETKEDEPAEAKETEEKLREKKNE